jgi:hypothetical protein
MVLTKLPKPRACRWIWNIYAGPTVQARLLFTAIFTKIRDALFEQLRSRVVWKWSRRSTVEYDDIGGKGHVAISPTHHLYTNKGVAQPQYPGYRDRPTVRKLET